MTFCVGLIPALVAAPYALRGNRGAVQIIILAFGAQLFVYFWLSRFLLEFTRERIGYRSLFRRYRTIQRDSIVEADFATECSRFESPFTFVVRTDAGDEVRINAKVFDRDALQHLLALAPQGSKHAIDGIKSVSASSSLHRK